MKRKTMFKHLTAPFMLIAFCLGLMVSCSEKEYPSEEGQSEEKETTYTFNFDIDEVPILSAQTEVITDTKKEDSEVEAAKPLTRSIKFTVPQSGNYPSVSLEENSTIDVYLLLYSSDAGYYGTKIFYSKNPVRLRVRNGKLHMSHRQVEFVGGKYTVSGKERQLKFNGDMAFNNKNKWMLSAIYAPGGTFNNGELSFEGSMPKRFLNAGEKLTVGSDINIPFVLGTINGNTRSIGVALDMDWDRTKVAEYNTGSPEAAKTENYTFRLKKGVNYGFYPIGTLFCMRFKNDMANIWIDPRVLGDAYWLGRNGKVDANKKKYDYKINRVFCRSTSVRGVFSLGKDLEFRPNGIVTQKFEIPANKNVDLNVDGRESPWLYFWQYSKNGAEDNALEITFDMYNKDLDMDKLARVYTLSASRLSNSQGKQYYKTVKLKNTLALTPLYTIGPTFTSRIDGDLTWGNSGESNAKVDEGNTRGVGRVYAYKELFVNNRFTSPFKVKDANGRNVKANNLLWVLPNEKMVRGIFPAHIETLSDIRWAKTKKQTTEGHQYVTVDGENVSDKAIYYYDGVRDQYGQNQKDGNSLRVYYAIRYIGTKYVSAWRYIEKGRWNGNLNNPNDQPIASKFIIQSRSLTLDVGARKYDNGSSKTYEYVKALAQDYLEQHVIKNSFWSDEVRDGETLNINSIDNLKPDVIKREFSLVGQWVLGPRANAGSAFTFWLYPTSQRIIDGRMFQVSNHDRDNLTILAAKATGRYNSQSMIIPFLMPGQGK